MGKKGEDAERSFNELSYKERLNLLDSNYKTASADTVVGNGESWSWGSLDAKSVVLSPFVTGGWKKGDATFFEDVFSDVVSGVLGTGLATGMGELNLNTKVPGKDEKTINVLTILNDKSL